MRTDNSCGNALGECKVSLMSVTTSRRSERGKIGLIASSDGILTLADAQVAWPSRRQKGAPRRQAKARSLTAWIARSVSAKTVTIIAGILEWWSRTWCRTYTVDIRHPHIAENQVDGLFFEEFESSAAMFGEISGISALLDIAL
tara:strand:- start:169 stop:600 length:432 start_codon:yes stop_codon:yes gene_type:complete